MWAQSAGNTLFYQLVVVEDVLKVLGGGQSFWVMEHDHISCLKFSKNKM